MKGVVVLGIVTLGGEAARWFDGLAYCPGVDGSKILTICGGLCWASPKSPASILRALDGRPLDGKNWHSSPPDPSSQALRILLRGSAWS